MEMVRIAEMVRGLTTLMMISTLSGECQILVHMAAAAAAAVAAALPDLPGQEVVPDQEAPPGQGVSPDLPVQWDPRGT